MVPAPVSVGTHAERGPLASPSESGYSVRLMHEVTQLLNALGQGDPHAASRLLPLVYEELRRLAAQRIAQAPSRWHTGRHDPSARHPRAQL
jgi:hypothetical protein